MTPLIDKILEHISRDILTDTEIAALIPGSPASRYNQVKRALAKGELIQVRRGFYHLAKRYQRQGINSSELAQGIYGPSYVSFESALSYHGLIPEAVYATTSASAKRTREFKTPAGVFTYTQVPISVFEQGVERIQKKKQIILMATPLKALADYVYAHKLAWLGIEPLIESLRIEKENLRFEKNEIEELALAYPSTRVTCFLNGLNKDLHS